MPKYDEREQNDIWTAIDNLQAALSTLITVFEQEIPKEDLKHINECIETVVNLI